MEQQISQVIFTNITKEEFLAGSRKLLSHEKKVHILRPGAIVLLQNHDTKAIFGIVRFGDFGCGKVWKEHSYLDTPDIYSGVNMKYNKYDIKLEDVFILPEEFLFEDLRYLLDIDNNFHNNITKTTVITFTPVFYKDEVTEQKVIRKLKLWVKSVAPHLLT